MVISTRHIISIIHSPVGEFNECYINFVICALLQILQYKWWRTLSSIYYVRTSLTFLQTSDFDLNANILSILKLKIVSVSALDSALRTYCLCVVFICEDIGAWPLRKCHLLACQIFAANGLWTIVTIVCFWFSSIETEMVSSLDALTTV